MLRLPVAHKLNDLAKLLFCGTGPSGGFTAPVEPHPQAGAHGYMFNMVQHGHFETDSILICLDDQLSVYCTTLAPMSFVDSFDVIHGIICDPGCRVTMCKSPFQTFFLLFFF